MKPDSDISSKPVDTASSSSAVSVPQPVTAAESTSTCTTAISDTPTTTASTPKTAILAVFKTDDEDTQSESELIPPEITSDETRNSPSSKPSKEAARKTPSPSQTEETAPNLPSSKAVDESRNSPSKEASEKSPARPTEESRNSPSPKPAEKMETRNSPSKTAEDEGRKSPAREERRNSPSSLPAAGNDDIVKQEDEIDDDGFNRSAMTSPYPVCCLYCFSLFLVFFYLVVITMLIIKFTDTTWRR